MNTYAIKLVDKKLNTISEVDLTKNNSKDIFDFIISLKNNGYNLIATGSSSKQDSFNPSNDKIFLAFRKKKWYER